MKADTCSADHPTNSAEAAFHRLCLRPCSDVGVPEAGSGVKPPGRHNGAMPRPSALIRPPALTPPPFPSGEGSVSVLRAKPAGCQPNATLFDRVSITAGKGRENHEEKDSDLAVFGQPKLASRPGLCESTGSFAGIACKPHAGSQTPRAGRLGGGRPFDLEGERRGSLARREGGFGIRGREAQSLPGDHPVGPCPDEDCSRRGGRRLAKPTSRFDSGPTRSSDENPKRGPGRTRTDRPSRALRVLLSSGLAATPSFLSVLWSPVTAPTTDLGTLHLNSTTTWVPRPTRQPCTLSNSSVHLQRPASLHSLHLISTPTPTPTMSHLSTPRLAPSRRPSLCLLLRSRSASCASPPRPSVARSQPATPSSTTTPSSPSLHVHTRCTQFVCAGALNRLFSTACTFAVCMLKRGFRFKSTTQL